MTAAPPQLESPPVVAPPVLPRWLFVSGLASLGAGAVHASAAGAHGDHQQAVLAFTALAAAQVLFGGAALVRRDRMLAAFGVLLGGVAVAGWMLAKLAGLAMIDGMEVAEPVQLADASAAGLASLSAVLAALALLEARGPRSVRLPLWMALAAIAGTAAVGTAATPSHQHSAGHDAGHAVEHKAGDVHPVTRPYDPALPIDLSGTPGVTPRQQAAAENLIAITLSRLPQWANATVAERAGFRSIGDGFTGTEHLINKAFQSDKSVLDPDRPESLVYDTTGGGRRLVAAMFMLAPGTPLKSVPDVGGALVQWHTHENLCYSPAGMVAGITDAAGRCPAGLVKPVPAPMVHVWITPHRCGPFAALEGIAGGKIPDGEVRLCDHAHGSAS